MHRLILVLTYGLFITQPQTPITFKTVTIVNANYIVSNDWKGIPVNNKTGEDVNSRKFGKIHYPPTTVGTDIRENRITIARESMEIEVDLINITDSKWLVDKVTLNVVKKHEIKQLDFTLGMWEIGIRRTSDYNPYFEIQNSTDVISDIPTEEFVSPKNNMSDSRIILEVVTADEIFRNGIIYEFNFTITLTEMGGNRKKRKITSDRNYFISSE